MKMLVLHCIFNTYDFAGFLRSLNILKSILIICTYENQKHSAKQIKEKCYGSKQ